jgi:hypothetical protein
MNEILDHQYILLCSKSVRSSFFCSEFPDDFDCQDSVFPTTVESNSPSSSSVSPEGAHIFYDVLDCSAFFMVQVDRVLGGTFECCDCLFFWLWRLMRNGER